MSYTSHDITDREIPEFCSDLSGLEHFYNWLRWQDRRCIHQFCKWHKVCNSDGVVSTTSEERLKVQNDLDRLGPFPTKCYSMMRNGRGSTAAKPANEMWAASTEIMYLLNFSWNTVSGCVASILEGCWRTGKSSRTANSEGL